MLSVGEAGEAGRQVDGVDVDSIQGFGVEVSPAASVVYLV